MRQLETLTEQLQRHHGHDATREREQHAVYFLAGFSAVPVLAALGEPEPEGSDAGAEGLAHAAEQGGPEHGFPAGVNGEVEREGHGEALGDVVDEEGEEDGETQGGVDVVCGIRNEAFGDLMQRDGNHGLQTNAVEDVGRDVVVVLGVGVAIGMGFVGMGEGVDRGAGRRGGEGWCAGLLVE